VARLHFIVPATHIILTGASKVDCKCEGICTCKGISAEELFEWFEEAEAYHQETVAKQTGHQSDDAPNVGAGDFNDTPPAPELF